MRTLSSIATGACLLLAGTAAMADGPGSLKDARSNEKPLSWTGFYFGAHAGHAWADANWTFTDATLFNTSAGEKFSHDPSGAFVGGQIGFNVQMGRWVWGVEGTLSSGISRTSVSPIFGDTFTTDVDALWTATSRLGYVWNRWLAYGKAGYAGGQVEVSANPRSTRNTIPANQTEVHHGWTIGAGIEHLVTQNVTFGVEYNYMDLGGKAASQSLILRVDNDVTAHAVMGRFGYKFDR